MKFGIFILTLISHSPYTNYFVIQSLCVHLILLVFRFNSVHIRAQLPHKYHFRKYLINMCTINKIKTDHKPHINRFPKITSRLQTPQKCWYLDNIRNEQLFYESYLTLWYNFWSGGTMIFFLLILTSDQTISFLFIWHLVIIYNCYYAILPLHIDQKNNKSNQIFEYRLLWYIDLPLDLKNCKQKKPLAFEMRDRQKT